MSDYSSWNKEIFNYYFSERQSEIDENYLFSVDSDGIIEIGKKLDIEDEPEKDFIKCIADVLIKRKNEKYKISLKDINIPNQPAMPKYTAIIAFYIYVASKMGSQPKFSGRAYWPIVKKLFEEFYDKDYLETSPNNNDYDDYFNLFEKFENELKNCNINFKFERNLFQKKSKNNTSKIRDFIGMPVFQSMLSEKDRCILTEAFDNYDKRNPNCSSPWNNPNFYKSIINYKNKDNCYGIVFNNILKNNDYKLLLKNKILSIAECWWSDKIVRKYNKNKAEISKIGLLLGYYQSEKEFKFGITAKIRDGLSEIFDHYKFKKSASDNYYALNENLLSDKKYMNKKIFPYNNKSLDYDNENLDYIELKLDIATNNYIQTNIIKEGEYFSILLKKEKYQKYYETLKDILEDQFNPIEINEDLILFHNIKVDYADYEFVSLDRTNKICFDKGLKNDALGYFTYIKGAEPKIKVTDLSYVIIDGEENDNSIIDIREKYNEFGKHIIKLENSEEEKSYEIVDIESLKNNNPIKHIYNTINDIDINQTNTFDENEINICGALIYEPQEQANTLSIDNIQENENILAKESKIIDDQNILITNETTNNDITISQEMEGKLPTEVIEKQYTDTKNLYYKFSLLKMQNNQDFAPILNKIKSNILNNLSRCKDEKLSNEINKYFEETKLTNSIKSRYMMELRKVLKNE